MPITYYMTCDALPLLGSEASCPSKFDIGPSGTISDSIPAGWSRLDRMVDRGSMEKTRYFCPRCTDRMLAGGTLPP